MAKNCHRPSATICRPSKQSADGLLELVNELLDLSRIEAGSFQLEATPFDLGKTVEQVVKTLGVRAGEKGLELVCDLGNVPTQLVGDPLRLRQVLTNLVGNAVKFTSKGTVIVSVESSPLARGWGRWRQWEIPATPAMSYADRRERGS